MMKSSLIRINLLFILLVLFIPNLTSAETKTFIKEYTYQASEFDSKHSSRTLALEQIKRLLLEELGTYLVSETEVKNMQLTKDQVTTYSAGIVHAEIIEEKWDGKTFWLKSKLSANPKEVEKVLKTLIEEKSQLKELEEIRKKAEELTKENARLRKELEVSSNAQKRDTKTEAKNIKAYENTIIRLNAVEWFNKGYEAGIAKRWEEALNAFSKGIELDPYDAEAYYNRGITYSALGKYQQALKEYTKAIELKPNNADAYYLRGEAYGKLDNAQKAIEDYTRTVELKPDDVVAYNNRGNLYNKLGNYQQAIKDFTKTLELKPDLAVTYYNRGNAYNKLGYHKQAIDDYTRAIELTPDFAEAYINRGNVYNKLGNYQQAIDEYKIAARLGDKSVQEHLKGKGINW